MANSWITVHTDGACQGNPGRAGWGAVFRFNEHKKIAYGKLEKMTSNQAEMWAVIKALETITMKGEGRKISIYSDSLYVVNSMNGIYSKKKNPNLWKKLDALVAQHSEVLFSWIPRQFNEEADTLAKKGVNGEYQKIIKGKVGELKWISGRSRV